MINRKERYTTTKASIQHELCCLHSVCLPEKSVILQITFTFEVLLMKKLNINELNNLIESQKSKVERILARDRKSGRIVRMHERDIDEQKILDILCIKRWEKAEEEGKVKYITERKWYYEFD